MRTTTTMRVTTLTLWWALAAGAAGAAAGQNRVDERRPAAADGTVVIEAGSGSLRVIGWERAEVAVSGSLDSDSERISLRGEPRKTRVEVIPLHHGHQAGADLEVRVPAGSRVEVESFQASIEVEGVTGSVRAETVNSAITMSGAADDVQLESVNGGVTVRGRSARIRAESTNGPVAVSDAGNDVAAGTVNGPLSVTGVRALARGRLESVNGRISFEGQLAPKGTLDIENVRGGVDVSVGGAADFQVSTFNGAIVNQLGPQVPAVAKDEDDDDEALDLELTFSVGGGGARVTVTTLSGRVRILPLHKRD